MTKPTLLLSLLFGSFFLAAGCGGESDGGPPNNPPPGNQTLEVAGIWASTYGFDETITEDAWGTATIVMFDNGENYAITQQPADDEFNPSKFSKLVWTEPAEGRFHYCIVEFGLATAEEAERTTKTADPGDLAGGCGGFPWTRLAEPIEIAGSFTSPFGMETISSHLWGTATVHAYDNGENWALTQWPSDDMYNPDKFNRVVWTEPTSGSFHYCIVDFGRDTLEQVETSTQTADASDPENGGCGSFPWTALSEG